MVDKYLGMGRCRFCELQSQLRKSHILPSFVWRWLKETSAGAIRFGQTPNRRVQDGIKVEFLCDACEQIFGLWEKQFAEQVFIPFHEGKADHRSIQYEAWALKFAVSVSWRVLTFYRELTGLNYLSASLRQEAVTASDCWRAFLLGRSPHPSRFEQHLIPLDIIESFSGGSWSPFLNRYLMRTVDMDVVASKDSAVVYSKLGRLLLIGFLSSQPRAAWKETRLHVGLGTVGGIKSYVVPGSLAALINSKAARAADRLASMSSNQSNLIQQAIKEKAESGELFETDVFRAMQQDVLLFGSDAFSVTTRDQTG